MLQGERELCTGAPGEPGMQQAGKQLLLHKVLTLGERQGWGNPVLLLKASARTPNPKGEGGESSSGISLSVLAGIPGRTLLGAYTGHTP